MAQDHNDIYSIVERLRVLEEGLDKNQRGVNQLSATFKPKTVAVLTARTDPKNPMAGKLVGSSESIEDDEEPLEEAVTSEDTLSKVKASFEDYLKSVADEVRQDSDIKDKTNNDTDLKSKDKTDRDLIAKDDMDEGWKSALGGAALAGAMALGGAGAAQAQSSGPNIVNPTAVIQQIQAGKIQNQNDLMSALGNASNKQAVWKVLQNTAGMQGSNDVNSIIGAIGHKNVAGSQPQATKSVNHPRSFVQNPRDDFEESKLAPVKTITNECGMFEVHGNEKTGFEIRRGNRRLPTRFKNLDEAEMALEMFAARQRKKDDSADYIDEA